MYKLRTKTIDLLRNNRGVAAVEFALILPIISLLMFGGISIFQSIQANRAVERSSEIASDLVSRMSKLDDAVVDNMFEITKSLIGGNADDPSFNVTISSISNTFDTNDNYDLEINWSFAEQDGKELKESQIKNFDLPFIPEGESIILVNVELDYAPPLYRDHFGSYSLAQASVRRPRFVPLVVYE